MSKEATQEKEISKRRKLLINRAHCRELALKIIDDRYQSDVMKNNYAPTRISGDFYEWLESEVRSLINRRIFNRSNSGRTL